MGAAETIEVTEHRVSCDGGGGALGHPTVYLEMGTRIQWNAHIAGASSSARLARSPADTDPGAILSIRG